MNPGANAKPCRLISDDPGGSVDPIAVIRSPVIATSTSRDFLPVPSKTWAPRRTRSAGR